MSNRKKALGILILFLWIIIIFLFSGSDASSSTAQTQVALDILSSIAEKNTVVNSFLLKLNQNNNIFYSIRKLAHLTVFCILQIITFTILRGFGQSFLRSSIYSLLIVFGYACLDEIHQYFVPGRSCQFTDVLIDSIGGFVGLVICFTVSISKKFLILIFNYFKQKKDIIG